jgi:hypothetical protein
MKYQKMMVSYFCVAVLHLSVNAFSAPVPDTGMTKCYSALNEITCPSPGQPFYGQDGSYSINPMSYTKLDIDFQKIHFARQQGGDNTVVYLRPITQRNYFSESL